MTQRLQLVTFISVERVNSLLICSIPPPVTPPARRFLLLHSTTLLPHFLHRQSVRGQRKGCTRRNMRRKQSRTKEPEWRRKRRRREKRRRSNRGKWREESWPLLLLPSPLPPRPPSVQRRESDISSDERGATDRSNDSQSHNLFTDTSSYTTQSTHLTHCALMNGIDSQLNDECGE